MRSSAWLWLGLLACSRRELETPTKPGYVATPAVSAAVASNTPASYVGSERCKDCHAQAYADWKGSQHQRAMQLPTAESVLGDFKNRGFTHRAERTRFSHDGAAYRVETLGTTRASGVVEPVRRSFDVKYTFGVAPLQQYLLDVGEGHLQALTVAYDTRPKDQGGRRWFQLQPDERTQVGDELHWTAPAYNWNSSCADCHSTNLLKRYDPEHGSYATSFSEISVGCEACHGPGSRHAEQAAGQKFDGSRGLERRFTAATDRHWGFTPGKPIASLAASADTTTTTSQVDACAFCHSHRVDLGGSGLEFHDRYRLDLLEPALYYPDGQQKGETFEVGSFLQSKMYAAGVVCSDCHEPHSGSLRRAGNALCGGCHDAKHYDTPTHHLHPTAGARECVQCHMPTRTFMEVDLRREHRFAVPRPDLTIALGVPNPCTESCHAERREPGGRGRDAAASWAAGVISEHFGSSRAANFAASLQSGQKLAANGRVELLALVRNARLPAIVRASALVELAAYPELRPADIDTQARDPNPLVRRACAELLGQMADPEAQRLLPRLLGDAVRSVRIEAARGLLTAPLASLSETDRRALGRALAELRASLEHNADRPAALLELARLELREAGPEPSTTAEALFRRALALDANFAVSYLNFADYLRTQKREPEALALLAEGIRKSRDDAALEHAFGLALVRTGETARGIEHLGKAQRLAPESNRLTYVYAVALFDTGQRDLAIATLEKAQQRAPGDLSTLELLAQYQRIAGSLARAEELDRALAAARSARP